MKIPVQAQVRGLVSLSSVYPAGAVTQWSSRGPPLVSLELILPSEIRGVMIPSVPALTFPLTLCKLGLSNRMKRSGGSHDD
jgi:hypothetical protein